MGSNVKISNDGAPKLWRKTDFRTRRRSMNGGGHPAHTVELARNSWLLSWCRWDIKCVPRLGLPVVHSQMVQTVTRSDSLTLFIQIIYIAPLGGDHSNLLYDEKNSFYGKCVHTAQSLRKTRRRTKTESFPATEYARPCILYRTWGAY